jgi:ParB family chromosome partitioning protein
VLPDPDQPRKRFSEESIARLAASLDRSGMMYPLRVRPERDRFRLIAGERRYRAAKQAGLQEVQCLITEAKLSPDELLEEQLIDNLHREDLDPIDQAEGYKRLMELRGWSASQLSFNLHLTKGTVSKTLALLGLPKEVKEQVKRGDLAPTVAYHVTRLPDPSQQREVAGLAVEHGLTRPAVEAVVRQRMGKAKAARRSTRREFHVEDGTRVAVNSERPLSPAELVGALAEALRTAYWASLPAKRRKRKRPSFPVLLEVLEAFAESGGPLEFAASDAMAVVAPLVIGELFGLLDHKNPEVRNRAGLAFNAISVDAKQAIAHLKPR